MEPDHRQRLSRPNQRPLQVSSPPPPVGDWQDRAACAGRGIRTWFPRGEQGMGMLKEERDLLAEAREVCGTCPVRNECLVYGLRWWRDLWGVWGGHTRTERRRLSEQLNRTPQSP